MVIISVPLEPRDNWENLQSLCAQLLNSRIRWLVCVRVVVTLEALGSQCRWQEGMMFSAIVVFTALCLGLVQILLNCLFACFSVLLLKQDLV